MEVPYVQSFAPSDGGQSQTLTLNSAHPFTITLVATDQHNNNVTGNGVALPQTDTFGYFSLPSITSNPSNPEVFVKILDGRAINGDGLRVPVALSRDSSLALSAAWPQLPSHGRDHSLAPHDLPPDGWNSC